MSRSTKILDLSGEPEDFNREAASLFISLVNEAIESSGKCNVALSGGQTPLPIFNRIKTEFKNKVKWQGVSFFWVDERCVQPDHFDSNFGRVHTQFLDSLNGIKEYRIKGEMNPEEGAKDYERCLQHHVPIRNGFPHFDLIWLGMGSDGHTASIFPDTEIITEKKKWVRSVWVDRIKAYRISMTFPVINNARNRMIVIKGNSKRQLYSEIKEKVEKIYPIQFINPSQSKDYWVISES